MDPASTKIRPGLELLPLEAKQLILPAPPDIQSLISTALTSTSLYDAFIDAEVLIINQVLLNEVQFEVFPEIVATLESSRREPRTLNRVQDFVAQHLQSRRPVSTMWTVSDTLAMRIS